MIFCALSLRLKGLSEIFLMASNSARHIPKVYVKNYLSMHWTNEQYKRS